MQCAIQLFRAATGRMPCLDVIHEVTISTTRELAMESTFYFESYLLTSVLAQGGGLFVPDRDDQSVVNKFTVNVPNYICQSLFTLSRTVNIPNLTLIQCQKTAFACSNNIHNINSLYNLSFPLSQPTPSYFCKIFQYYSFYAKVFQLTSLEGLQTKS
jgi:hypothetical protein